MPVPGPVRSRRHREQRRCAQLSAYVVDFALGQQKTNARRGNGDPLVRNKVVPKYLYGTLRPPSRDDIDVGRPACAKPEIRTHVNRAILRYGARTPSKKPRRWSSAATDLIARDDEHGVDAA